MHERKQVLLLLSSRLEASTEFRASGISREIDQLAKSALFLAQVPEVRDIVVKLSNAPPDSPAYATDAAWRRDLTVVFSSYLSTHPDLTHIRFIGVANDGLELVRVTHDKHGIVVARPEQLRQKGDRDYVQSLLQQSHPQVFVSDISRHEESDDPEYHLVQTMRAAAPVYASNGRLFGMIVVNLDVLASFSDLVRNSSNEIRVSLSNSEGDYLLPSDGNAAAATDSQSPLRWQDAYRLVSSPLGKDDGLQTFIGPHGLVNAIQRRIPLGATNQNRFLTLVVQQPDELIDQQVLTAQRIALSIILGVATLVIGALLVFLRQKRKVFEKQTELAAIVENAHDAIIGKTLEGRVTSWNNGAQEMFGYSAVEAIGRLLTELIVPSVLFEQERSILQQISRGERVENLVTTRRRKDGSEIDVSIMISPIRNAAGKVTGAAATARDITREKTIENEILGLNATLEQQVIARTAEIQNYSVFQQAILTSAGLSIIATDTRGVVTLFNPAAERMLGYQASEVVNLRNAGIFHDPDEVAARAAQWTEELGELVLPGFEVFVTRSLRGLSNEFEWTYIRKDGYRVPVLLNVTVMRLPDGGIFGYLGIAADLTERQAAAQALEEKTRFLETLSANIPGLVAYWDRDLRCRFANDSYFDWFGQDKASMQGMHLRQLLGERLFTLNSPYITAALQGKTQHFERSLTKPDGSIGHTWTHYIPDIDGTQVRGFIVLVSDITELKQAQLALEALNSKLELRSNDLERSGQLAGVGVWSVNLQTNEIVWSDQTCRIHDMPIGHRPTMEEVVSFYAPEARAEIEAVMAHTIAHKQSWEREFPLITAKGRHIWARGVGEVEVDAMGQPTRLVGAFQDITERRLASTALAAARDQLEMASKVAKLGIWAYELADQSLHWNDLMYELYDRPDLRSEPQLFYRHWQASVHPDDVEETMAQLLAAVEGRKAFDRIFRIVRRDGEIRHIQAGAFIEHDSNGNALRVTGINLDITEHVVLESSLRAAKELSDAANRAKSDFLANMSHEIRTPMNAILGMLQLLQQTMLNPRQEDYTRKAETAARTLLSILNDILDFSKVEAGKLSIDLHPFSIDRMLRDMSVILSSNLGNKEVEILFRIEPTIPTWLIGDDLRLQQILINLAGNAIKFTERGEVVLSVNRRMSDTDQLLLSFEVRDTGIGISPEQCERIFDGFSQAEASTARRFGGSGLGLAISQRLVRLMGGSLSVQSTPGVGSTFYFTIPCEVAHAPEPSDNVTHTVDLYDLNCLVIDDHATAREVLSDMLRSFGWSVDAFSSGQEATTILADDDSAPPYDVVFLDWSKHGVDGLQTCSSIRQTKRLQGSAIITMVTAYGRESLAQQQAQYPGLFNGMLIKPVTASMMFDAVAEHRALQGQNVHRENKSARRAQRLRGIHVLLVEDNLINQQVARELLSNEGAIVSIANCGQDGIDAVALAQTRGVQLDVVLMDIQMPDMDGYAATRLLRQRHDRDMLPIIAMTANVMQADREAALNAGMNDHVGKPIDLDRLVAVILQYARGGDRAITAIGCELLPANDGEEDDSAQSVDLDVIGALQRLGGNLVTYQRALKSFIGEISTFESACRQAIEEGRYDDVRRLLHTTKGLAGNVGAQRLAELAAEGERLLQQPAAQQAWPAMESLSQAARNAAAAARDYLAQCEPAPGNGSGHHPPDITALRTGLEFLVRLLAVADLQADEVFEQLHATYGKLMPEEFEQLERSITQLDYVRAGTLCNALLEHITVFSPE
ncbi:hypothetical protein FHW67_001490 [Herbaspirillum sp. Sphag1AN]|uniref:PAS domain S-box protein n=1 Tax=unclassified Herbaspirillum TaxID=2624150 RepID=UPI0016185B2A|nr:MULTISPECIES: PAS domain S-box protein [unclassified Herbaspirillum]MBB3212210.1 hypothetical protein [Herbaspirillum sp. Sphag1AN]MBB3245692.1 hypothetical protein [Herbaspirillum sp. Sphag64]